ncbi:bifunctional diaminohydroxyphosphoribosylaminopyrimidine deaminase/5-amino-6-(5-phosphoribosylamino)uracil reductase RibD [Kocuria tytonicola]|uniref:Riboflavin biosynthesis protein RibD n=3 Tax=Kocuria tytonicola TaxID=2055946 RepID=A0A3L9L8S3_9MICC|nr:bifunctional diaminohydroxyphosphoribosylaminopyrimidine deaminase/5-amino-6-(5-phosphoribosylamino)uracil reductase RibD [Kocuria tytonicola]
MRSALRAAARGVRGANPVVGAAVLSASGEVLHVGHHRGAGTPHAEVDALRAAREAGTDLRDTTLVVTLEPCHHTGRTGPCSGAILEAGVPRVVYAVGDGTDTARGGAAALMERGVDVRAGLLAEDARDLNARWFRAQEQQRPFVTLKIAQSLDGRVAAADGTSRWITGEAARGEGHALRSRVDAILVGGGTLRSDDPSLTARDATGGPLTRQPLRAVMTTRPVPADARVRRGVVRAEEHDGRFVHLDTHDPHEALARLRGLGVSHVLVEGGPTVAAAFLSCDLVDELWLHQAPVLLGAGAPSVGDLGIGTITAASRWRGDPVGVPDDRAVAPVGEDLRWHLRPARGTPDADSLDAGASRPGAPATPQRHPASRTPAGPAPTPGSGPADARGTATNSPDDTSSAP